MQFKSWRHRASLQSSFMGLAWLFSSRPTRAARLVFGLGFAVLLLSNGCATYKRQGLAPEQARAISKCMGFSQLAMDADLQQQILALDPELVTGQQVREILSQAPAPRIINIHGGIYPVHRQMISFSHFLIGMGYPEASITNPADGTYTFSCYENAKKIAGMIAWYYEKEGMRPMAFGHSQGGFQVVKILRLLAGHGPRKLPVWNPLTWKPERRYEITDPLTGKIRPVVGLELSYACSVGAGGITRLLPNQWDMMGHLRDVPSSVDEFTGFYKGWDLLGGDFLGWGGLNNFESEDKANVRNVRLPSEYRHGKIPGTEHLLKDPRLVDWINEYQPPKATVSEPKLEEEFGTESKHILWAADVWHSIKRHWVIELQQLIKSGKLSAKHDS